MPTRAHTGRRDLSRAQVEETALGLFHAHGVDAVTVEQICAASGIAPATFYRYFGTKDGVLFAYRPRFLDAIRAATAGVPTSGPNAQLKSALLSFAQFLDEHADALRKRDAILTGNPVLLASTLLVQREWEQELAAGLARARGVPDTDPEVWWDAAIGLVVMRAAIRRWRTGDIPTMRLSVIDAMSEAVDMLSRRTDCGAPPVGTVPSPF